MLKRLDEKENVIGRDRKQRDRREKEEGHGFFYSFIDKKDPKEGRNLEKEKNRQKSLKICGVPSKGRRDFSSPFSLGWVSDSMGIDPIRNSSRYLLEVVRRQILMLNQKA